MEDCRAPPLWSIKLLWEDAGLKSKSLRFPTDIISWGRCTKTCIMAQGEQCQCIIWPYIDLKKKKKKLNELWVSAQNSKSL